MLLQEAENGLRKPKVYFLENKVKFTFSENCSAQLHTPPNCHAPIARTALKSMDGSREHGVGSTRAASASFLVQTANASSRKFGVQSFQKEGSFPFSEILPAQPRTTGLFHALFYKLHCLATQLSYVAFYGTRDAIAQYLQHTVYRKSDAL